MVTDLLTSVPAEYALVLGIAIGVAFDEAARRILTAYTGQDITNDCNTDDVVDAVEDTVDETVSDAVDGAAEDGGQSVTDTKADEKGTTDS